jgi:hypothetical protein
MLDAPVVEEELHRMAIGRASIDLVRAAEVAQVQSGGQYLALYFPVARSVSIAWTLSLHHPRDSGMVKYQRYSWCAESVGEVR